MAQPLAVTAPSPKLVAPPPHLTLYHGSVGLYMIQAYVNQHKHLLDAYLSQLATQTRVVNFSDTLLDMINAHLAKLRNRLKTEHSPQVNANNPVLFLVFLRVARKLGVAGAFSVAELVLSALPDRGNLRSALPRQADIMSLVSFAYRVEECASLAEVEKRGLLNSDFYSSMRQPIQFFGLRDTAKLYAHERESFLYAYDLNNDGRARRLLLLDIDNPATIAAMTQPGMPFHQASQSLTDAQLEFISESNAAELRSEIFERHFGGSTGLEGVELDPAYAKSNPLVHSMTMSTPQCSEAVFRAAMRDLLHAKCKTSRDAWLMCMRGAGLDTDQLAEETVNAALVDRLVAYLKRKSDEPFVFRVEEHRQFVTDFFDAQRRKWFNYKLKEDNKNLVVLPAVRYMARVFGVREDTAAGQVVKEFLEHGTKPGGYLEAIEVFRHWDEMFQVELLSPRSLWMSMYPAWLYDPSSSPTRLSSYMADALVIHILRNSKWLSANSDTVIGWICSSMDEWMIIHPERHGKMRKERQQYDVPWKSPLNPFANQPIPEGTAGRAQL